MGYLGSGFFIIIWLAIAIFYFVTMWKVYVKAGQPGWGIFIPFYNVYLMIKIAGRPGWWLILYFIPIVNIVIEIIVAIDVAKNFGKSTGFGWGLFLLGFIFFPILAFGSATYNRGETAASSM